VSSFDWTGWIEWFGSLREQLSWFWLILLAGPFIPLALWKRIYPTNRLVLAICVPTVMSVTLAVQMDVFPVLIALDSIIALIALADLITVPRAGYFRGARQTLKIVSLRNPHRVEIVVENLSRRTLPVVVRDDVPPEFTVEMTEFELSLAPQSRATMHYDMQALRRGAYELRRIFLKLRSKLGLWSRILTIPAESKLNVYPDLKQLAEYALLARTNRLTLLGVRRTRKVGQDHEFERLRDYLPDDNYKHMEWRATARRQRLTVKDFQSSQSQRLIFMIDCGRMMTNEANGLSLLDHALNSMLMLSYVALRQGDSVGMLAFSDRVHTYVPPKGGMKQMNNLMHASFDRFPQLVESRYDEAFLHLSSHCRKRALVVFITSVFDEVNANQIQRYLAAQVGRHLPLGCLIRDRQLFSAADAGEKLIRGVPAGIGSPDLYQAAVAAHILSWRQQVISDLTHQGVLCLDLFPEEMTAPLVNKYLELKARHLL
jgi:uncharacterized protein (DUF58 family)